MSAPDSVGEWCSQWPAGPGEQLVGGHRTPIGALQSDRIRCVVTGAGGAVVWAVGIQARTLAMLASLGLLHRLELRGRRMRAREVVSGRMGVTRAHVNAQARELAGGEQPYRSRTDHQYFLSAWHWCTPFPSMQTTRSLPLRLPGTTPAGGGRYQRCSSWPLDDCAEFPVRWLNHLFARLVPPVAVAGTCGRHLCPMALVAADVDSEGRILRRLAWLVRPTGVRC
jgi:hypothetical protein